MNPAVPDRGPVEAGISFPIAAIGASAGGLSAFRALLGNLPAETGMAYVFIQHMNPEAESMLPQILQRSSRMPVRVVENQVEVRPNHVYVIPPGKDMVYTRGRLELAPRTEMRGMHHPIDHFMRSLAEEHSFRSIGVVLSGAASDGTLGLQEIKTAGGITIAQDHSAEHSSMPRSAIASGYVDLVLPPAEIASELARVARHPLVAPDHALERRRESEPVFPQILQLVHGHTGMDFSHYKPNTLHRRITRRMVLHRLDSLADYAKLLQRNPKEIDALYHDILINVTSFFRNPDAYEAIKERVFPRIAAAKGGQETLRVWALGCSTGEEAYSIAMAYQEYAEETGQRKPMQIFATDLNSAGIERARAGLYPRGIAQDVSPARLRRFFLEVDGHYRIAKSIRDMCVFAAQNALADPPFSRMDLIACRNMLIYLDSRTQHMLMPLLHYGLREGGYLWLGSSESIGSFRELFEVDDANNKIYAKKTIARGTLPPRPMRPRGENRLDRIIEARSDPPDPQSEADRLLLSRYAPPGVVLDENFDIQQFRGDTSVFLAPAPGKASLNVLTMLREGLMVGVRGALHRAKREKVTVRKDGLRMKAPGGNRVVNVVVVPMRQGSASWLLLIFEDGGPADAPRPARSKKMTPASRSAATGGAAETRESEVERLVQELNATREYLQSVIEQQEAANEELQSANEEAQSANEELQSINEELETTKEEIESANEELATVNGELQSLRNTELTQSNNDLMNLLTSEMPIVMLGKDLRIRMFTASAEKLFILTPAHLGLPITDIELGLAVPDLARILNDVIGDKGTFERDVRDRSGRWHLLRVRQYRNSDYSIEGAVLLLIDIDSIKRVSDQLRESEWRAAPPLATGAEVKSPKP